MRIADLQKLDDEALGQALAQAFADLPEAEPARLALVRDRLPLAIKANSKNRWAQLILIGVLSGSGLALAWWGVATFFSPASEVRALTPASHAAPPSQAPARAPVENQAITPSPQSQQPADRRSPIIYQQEQY